VEATREQLNAVKDLIDLTDNEDPAETSFSKQENLRREIRLLNTSLSQPDLEMVRKSSLVDDASTFMRSEMVRTASLVDDDSAFMRSEISEDRGYLPSALQSSTPSRNHPGALHEGLLLESHSYKESPSHGFSNNSSLFEESAESLATSEDDFSASTCSDTDTNTNTNTNTKTTFEPPREIARVKSDVTSKSSPDRLGSEQELTRKPSSDGPVRNMSTASYKRAMSEKVSRRLRSLGRNQHSDLANSIIEADRSGAPSSSSDPLCRHRTIFGQHFGKWRF
jgi:hypothetical protein